MMNPTLRMLAVSAVAVGLAAGCAQYTGTVAARAGRTPGQFADDQSITAKVSERLQKDPTVQALPIQVQTYQNEVQLSGFVEFPQQAQRAAEIARSVADVRQVTNDIIVKRQMGWDERLRLSQGGGMDAGQQQAQQPTQQQAQQQPQRQTFRGEVTNLSPGAQDNLRVRTEQGELPVRAAQWDQKKEQLNLQAGDNVRIRGFVSGLGAQRHIVAEEITANGQTVQFPSTGQPYRETGLEQDQPQQPPMQQ